MINSNYSLCLEEGKWLKDNKKVKDERKEEVKNERCEERLSLTDEEQRIIDAEQARVDKFSEQVTIVDKKKQSIFPHACLYDLKLSRVYEHPINASKQITMREVTEFVIRTLNENIKNKKTHPVPLNPGIYFSVGMARQDYMFLGDHVKEGWIWKILDALVKAKQIDSFMYDRRYSQYRVKLITL